jgi:hypothetical protein
VITQIRVVATGGMDPELARCCASAWSVAHVAAFQHVARKFAMERQFKFAVVYTDVRCAESRAAQHFLAHHRSLSLRAPHAPAANSDWNALGGSRNAFVGSPQVAWFIWRPGHHQRCRLFPGPALQESVKDAIEAWQQGSEVGPPRWAVVVHVLDSVRQQALRAAENALEAALSGSGAWEEAKSLFAV